MKRWTRVLALGSFLTLSAFGCSSAERVTEPSTPRYDIQQDPTSAADTTGLPEAGAEGDTTGRWGGALGSGT